VGLFKAELHFWRWKQLQGAKNLWLDRICFSQQDCLHQKARNETSQPVKNSLYPALMMGV
jgi:hypothetical protein